MPPNSPPFTPTLGQWADVKAAMPLPLFGSLSGWRKDEWVSSCLTAHKHSIGYSIPLTVECWQRFTLKAMEKGWGPASDSCWLATGRASGHKNFASVSLYPTWNTKEIRGGGHVCENPILWQSTVSVKTVVWCNIEASLQAWCSMQYNYLINFFQLLGLCFACLFVLSDFVFPWAVESSPLQFLVPA